MSDTDKMIRIIHENHKRAYERSIRVKTNNKLESTILFISTLVFMVSAVHMIWG